VSNAAEAGAVVGVRVGMSPRLFQRASPQLRVVARRFIEQSAASARAGFPLPLFKYVFAEVMRERAHARMYALSQVCLLA